MAKTAGRQAPSIDKNRDYNLVCYFHAAWKRYFTYLMKLHKGVKTQKPILFYTAVVQCTIFSDSVNSTLCTEGSECVFIVERDVCKTSRRRARSNVKSCIHKKHFISGIFELSYSSVGYIVKVQSSVDGITAENEFKDILKLFLYYI